MSPNKVLSNFLNRLGAVALLAGSTLVFATIGAKALTKTQLSKFKDRASRQTALEGQIELYGQYPQFFSLGAGV